MPAVRFATRLESVHVVAGEWRCASIFGNGNKAALVADFRTVHHLEFGGLARAYARRSVRLPSSAMLHDHVLDVCPVALLINGQPTETLPPWRPP